MFRVREDEVIKMDCPYVEGSFPCLVLLSSGVFWTNTAGLGIMVQNQKFTFWLIYPLACSVDLRWLLMKWKQNKNMEKRKWRWAHLTASFKCSSFLFPVYTVLQTLPFFVTLFFPEPESKQHGLRLPQLCNEQLVECVTLRKQSREVWGFIIENLPF